MLQASRPSFVARTLLCASLALVGCGEAAVVKKAASPEPAVAPPSRKLAGPPPMKAAFVTTLEDEAAPYAYAREGKLALVAYVKGGQVVVQPVDLDGTSRGEPAVIATASHPSAITVVRQAGAFYVAWDDKVEQNRVLTYAVVDVTGQKRGGPFKLAPIASEVGFFDFARAGDASFLVYELSAAEGTSDLYGVQVDEHEPKAARSPVPIAKGVHAWAATSTPDAAARDVAFGLVRGKADAQGNVRGRVSMVRLDATGKVSPEIVVRDKPTAELDLQIAQTAGGELFAWTDYEDPEGLVFVARVRDGKVELAPRRLFEAPGPQALVGLTAPETKGNDVLVGWETPEDAGAVRSLRLTHVTGADAKPARTVGLLFAGQGVPDLAPDADGYALLTLAPAIYDGAPEAANPPIWPTIVRFDKTLTPRSSEPVRFPQAAADTGVPDVTHALACEKGRCTILSHSLAERVNVFVVEAPVRDTTWHSVARTGATDAATLVPAASLAENVDVSDVAALRLSGTKGFAAYVTFLAEGTASPEAAPKGEPPYAAELAILPLEGNALRGKPLVVSKRALSAGGVAVASLPGKQGQEAAIAWVASDKGEPQVFVTKLDEDGKKLGQKKVTTVDRKKRKSGASSVAIASASDGKRPPGYVVAWVDTRDGKAEVYAARVNRDLEKTVVDKRLTSSQAGDAADLSIVVRDKDAFVAFSGATAGGPGDIFLLRLDAATLEPATKEVRVFASEGHSRAPQLIAVGDKLMLLWIEDAPSASEGRSALRVGFVDPGGQLEREPARIDVPGGAITSYAVTCKEDKTCSVAITAHRAAAAQELWTTTVSATGVPAAVEKRGTLDTRAATDLSLRFLDPKTLVFVEPGARGRVRSTELR